eukprot:COSAG01_NODE_48828_length_377_cov_1.579137_1_plen_65_part_10
MPAIASGRLPRSPSGRSGVIRPAWAQVSVERGGGGACQLSGAEEAWLATLTSASRRLLDAVELAP